jgi:hypothetical protein
VTQLSVLELRELGLHNVLALATHRLRHWRDSNCERCGRTAIALQAA